MRDFDTNDKVLVQSPYSKEWLKGTITRVLHPVFFDGYDVRIQEGPMKGQVIPAVKERVKERS